MVGREIEKAFARPPWDWRAVVPVVAVVQGARLQQSPRRNAHLQSALISDELVPYYQPIVDINSGKLLGAAMSLIDCKDHSL